MELSQEQEQALKKVSAWLSAGKQQVFRLFGYAGTGKTTLARYFAESVDGLVQFVAFTGKAAEVLRSKGAYNACTIHSLIYSLRGEEEIHNTKTGKMLTAPTFVLNRHSTAEQAKLIVVDECSMVDEPLGRDLMSFGTPILVLGDAGQLPPIGEGGFFTNHLPDFQLEEIFRQAKDNAILKLARDARLGRPIPYGDYGEAKVISRREVTSELILQADQVLVGRNRTRQLYNQRIRSLKGFETVYPECGDKLVCLRNDAKKGLLNGSLWTVCIAGKETDKLTKQCVVVPEDSAERSGGVRIKLVKAQFEDPNLDIPWKMKKRYDSFDFGYALTVHKAQGSQWDNVVLFDESDAFPDYPEKWLYTGITRAAKTLTIVR